MTAHALTIHDVGYGYFTGGCSCGWTTLPAERFTTHSRVQEKWVLHQIAALQEALTTAERERDLWHQMRNAEEKALFRCQAEVERLEAVLRRLAHSDHDVEEYPDHPTHWDVKLVCRLCCAYAQDIDGLDRAHVVTCPTRIAREALAAPKEKP